MTASSSYSGFPATNANDGSATTYWESQDGAAYPQTLTANPGQSLGVGSVTLTLPPSSSWSARTQTFSVPGSTNGSTWTTLVGSAGYTFRSVDREQVSFNLPSGTNEQYLELNFTGNTGWTAAQVSEFEIFPGSSTSSGGGTSSATLTASRSSLAFGDQATNSTSAAKSVTIQNTGGAAATISGITAGTGFAETNTCGSGLAAGASCTARVTFNPTAAQAYSANLTVSSSATNSTLTVALTGTGTGTNSTTDLALNKSISASSYTQTYVAANADDGDTGTYWESVNGSWPATLTVDLGSAQTLGSTVIDLPPSSSWGTRTQTLSVLGSGDVSTWSTIVASATYTWDPSTGNTVTIDFPSGTSYRYVRLSITANNVQNGGQVSEWQIFG